MSMAAARAARELLRAVARGETEIVLPVTVRQVARAAALAPNLTNNERPAEPGSRQAPDASHGDERK